MYFDGFALNVYTFNIFRLLTGEKINNSCMNEPLKIGGWVSANWNWLFYSLGGCMSCELTWNEQQYSQFIFVS